MLTRTIAAALVLVLASCDQKPESDQKPGNWLERSEKICGPGYVNIKGTNSDISVCIPYKLPDQKP